MCYTFLSILCGGTPILKSWGTTVRTRLIVNTTAGKGHAGKVLPQVQQYLVHYGVDYDLTYTQAPGQGVDLARQAAAAGYERVVAMGGDGTADEVANGLLLAAEEGYQTVLGTIPVGSGNDFSYAVGIPADLEGACQRLAAGQVRTVDVIRVTVDGQPHIFDNSVGIGYDADVSLETRKIKLLRGFPMYLWAVFRVLATNGKWPYPMRITVDGQPLPHQAVTLITVANGPRAGGGFYLTPDAQPDDGLLDICVADQLGRIGILQLLPHAMRGTHVDKKSVTMLQARHVLIESDRGLPGHVDGEILCVEGRRIEFEILPGRLKVWC
jgi:diacylglycerol kinase (ATP)